MKTIQFILFLTFISGFSILMINSGRINPQIEQQQNSYWTVIANAQSEPVSTSAVPESDHCSSPAGTVTAHSTGYYPGAGRGSNANGNLSVSNRNPLFSNRNLSSGQKPLSGSGSITPLHSRIIQSTLQPVDLIISPAEAASYAATLNAKMHYVTNR